MANEKRLIDANELLRIYKKWIPQLALPEDEGDKRGVETCIAVLEDQPTVDAVEVADMKEFAKDVVYQFGCYWPMGERLYITSGGLSTLEWAFDILGWENPHPVPECECEIEGCHEHATCGAPTADGYKRMCSRHYLSHSATIDVERKNENESKSNARSWRKDAHTGA